MDVGEAPEQVHAVHGDAVRDADEADVPAGTGRVERLFHRLLRTDRLHHRVGTEPVGQLLDRGTPASPRSSTMSVAPNSRARR